MSIKPSYEQFLIHENPKGQALGMVFTLERGFDSFKPSWFTKICDKIFNRQNKAATTWAREYINALLKELEVIKVKYPDGVVQTFDIGLTQSARLKLRLRLEEIFGVIYRGAYNTLIENTPKGDRNWCSYYVKLSLNMIVPPGSKIHTVEELYDPIPYTFSTSALLHRFSCDFYRRDIRNGSTILTSIFISGE